MVFSNFHTDSEIPQTAAGLRSAPFELVCPAGSLPALKAAVDNGASCVY
ncbi:MAG: family peptidase, partial [Polaromonas sp.]|nr:family peptidase [Polaromonas sp.]